MFELSQAAEAEPELILRQGRCLAYGEGVAFWALAEIVKAQAGILESDAPEEAERKLREAAAGDPWVESGKQEGRPGLGAPPLLCRSA